MLAVTIGQCFGCSKAGCLGKKHSMEAPPVLEDLYPNCDLGIWLRNCEHEVTTPLTGITSGIIPKWLSGSLLRNGPGKTRYEKQALKHLFDGAGLLHRFAIKDGKVTYQRQFVRSKSYVSNTSAGKVVIPEFGTTVAPDLCKTIFHRIASLFVFDNTISDNAMISVYPVGEEVYAFAESPFAHRIDPVTLETTGRVDLKRLMSYVNQSSHPHVTNDGCVYHLGQAVGKKGPCYTINRIVPGTTKPFEKAEAVASVPCRWRFRPCYMHSFSLTDRYFVLVEQPLTAPLIRIVGGLIAGKPLIDSLRWKNEKTFLRIIPRSLGTELRTQYVTDTLFFLHTINAYEDMGHLVVDVCCYRNPDMLKCMYVDALKNAQRNPDYARMFRGRPMRFVLPLNPKPNVEGNLNKLAYSRSEAKWQADGTVYITPEELWNLGCETPSINYKEFNGKPYRYFYAISSDVDAKNPGTLIKVDTLAKTCKTWSEKNVYASEPIFVPRPNPQGEDDGVVLSALIWGGDVIDKERKAGLLVLDAATWQEIGRTVFLTPGETPKCLHGWFFPNLI